MPEAPGLLAATALKELCGIELAFGTVRPVVEEVVEVGTRPVATEVEKGEEVVAMGGWLVWLLAA